MNISKKEVGEGLKKELNKGFNIERISNWAYDHSIKFHNDSELDDILDQISLMDAGPEFEYSEEELMLLSKMLMNEEENPTEKINEHASNRNLGSQMLDELEKGNNISKWALVKEIVSNFDFADSSYKSCKTEKTDLIVYIRAWNEITLTVRFINAIQFIYRGGSFIVGIYEKTGHNSFLDEALKSYYEKVPNDHPFKLFAIMDDEDSSLFEVAVEDIILSKE